MTDDYSTGADFGRATASWFGLDVDKVSDVQFSNPLHEPLTVTITIQINPDDVTGIGKRMKEIAAGSNGIASVGPKDGEYGEVDGHCGYWLRNVSEYQLRRAVAHSADGKLKLIPWIAMTDVQRAGRISPYDLGKGR